MDTSQEHEPFVEPPLDDIAGITRAHVAAMHESDSDDIWVLAGMRHVIIHTKGRRTGKEHDITVPFWVDADGHRVVVASFAGAPQHPSWYLNLADRTANPEVLVEIQHGRFWAEPQVLEGDDYTATWAALTTDRPFYNDYQSRCERRIPLVRLVELRPA